MNNLIDDRSKDATEHTKQINLGVLKDPVLDWEDKVSFEDVARGFIACDDPLIIKDENGNVVFNMEIYKNFIKNDLDPPATVNPSLWRHAKLNLSAGLFKITDHVYEVRGYDLAVMGVIDGKSSYIIIDALSTEEQSKKALELVYNNLGKKPVSAVIITHSHADHFGGVTGIVNKEDVVSGNVKVIAPDGFTRESLSENILAGAAMNRRTPFQFGYGLPQNAKGVVDSGIGKYRVGGTRTFMPPNQLVKETGEIINIDGVEFVFVMSPDTEAPAELEIYLPQFKTLCVSENANMTIHNLYPIRGALTRDARVWVDCFNEMLEMFPDADIAFGTHFWPVWGNKNVRHWLEKQRDMIKYLHDQTLRLANLGYTGQEISQMIELPPSLASEWFNRGYYGSISHNVRAIYTRYLGWYDGNVANLNPLPPEETSKRMVEYMGGSQEVINKANQAFEKGEYRWVAQLLNMVVFADPNNVEARNLEADALEQLGYQQECATWRNAYLVGAKELRTNVNTVLSVRTLYFYNGMPEKDLFETLAVSLNGPKSFGSNVSINFIFTDSNKRYLLTLNNSVVHTYDEKSNKDAELTIKTDKVSFIKLFLLKVPINQILDSKKVELKGSKSVLNEIINFFDIFNCDFNTVLP